MPTGTHDITVSAPPALDALAHGHTAAITDFGCTDAVSILQIDTIDSTHIRVTFAQPVVDNAALRCPETYTVTPPVDEVSVLIESVTPEGDPPESVLLETTEMRQGLSYTLDIAHIEAA